MPIGNNGYLSQDAENQFGSIFFQNGDYDDDGIMIKFIGVVGPVSEVGDKWAFNAWPDDSEDNFLFRYDSKQEAVQDRIRLLMQIEAFYSRGDS